MESTPIFTDRLLMRPFQYDDIDHLFALDSDPQVVRFLGNKPLLHKEEAVHYLDSLLQQYQNNKIARYAIFERESGQFIGWSGIKWITDEVNGHSHFYDLGYRFRPAFWQKGYATESAISWVEFARDHLPVATLYACAHIENMGSQHVLTKVGFEKSNTFTFLLKGEELPCFWYKMDLNE